MIPFRAKAAARSLLTSARRSLHARPTIDASPRYAVRQFGEPGFHTFFGYHDVTPFGTGDRLLLAVRCEADGNSQSAGRVLQIGAFELLCDFPRFESLATTTAWCWQQTCRLQWYPQEDGERIFFNATEGDRHCGVIVDVSTGRRATLGRALYALSPNGAYGSALNFSRLQRLRPGYGYGNLPDTRAGSAAPPDDGLWTIDLPSEHVRYFVSLAEVAAIDPDPSMSGAEHYFNHVLWSPGSRRCFFLHCWTTAARKRRSRAFIWDLHSHRCTRIGPAGQVSHHCWIDDERLVVFTTENGRSAYHLYHVEHGLQGPLGSNAPAEDGHPSALGRGGRYIVTDTYPDSLDEQALLVYDTQDDATVCLAKLYSPPRFRGETRCDLHPRWSRAGSNVCIDSAHAGERRLCVVDVEDLAASGDAAGSSL